MRAKQEKILKTVITAIMVILGLICIYPFIFMLSSSFRVYLRSQKCWDIRQKAPDARRMSAALLGGMQANATRQMGLFGRIEQR